MAVRIVDDPGAETVASIVGHPLRPLSIDLWDPERCARELRMSATTLRHLGKSGPPKVKLGGKVWYRPEGVKKWLEAKER